MYLLRAQKKTAAFLQAVLRQYRTIGVCGIALISICDYTFSLPYFFTMAVFITKRNARVRTIPIGRTMYAF